MSWCISHLIWEMACSSRQSWSIPTQLCDHVWHVWCGQAALFWLSSNKSYSLNKRIIKGLNSKASFLCSQVLLYNSANPPLKHKTCVSHACHTQLCFAVTLDEIRAAFRNLMAAVHVVAMEIATFKCFREAFVLSNCCKEWQNTCGRLVWRMFDCFLIYSSSLLLRRFSMETNCPEQGCCVFLPKSLYFSWTLLKLSLPLKTGILDKFM